MSPFVITARAQSTHGAGLIIRAERALALWHLASLDAPTVALVWSLAFAWSARVQLQLWVPVIQALGVWTIYVADRLLDARRAFEAGNIDGLRERHFFHWQHRRFCLPAAALSACLCACLVFHCIPLAARERDSFLAAAALVYFTRVHFGDSKTPPSRAVKFPLFSKEFFVGLLFTTGCVLPAMVRAAAAGRQLWLLLVPACFFAMLAWLNCYAIDRWESRAHCRPLQTISFAASCIAGACLIAAWAAHASAPRPADLLAAAAASALLLALLDRTRSRLAPLTLRAAADLALLTPAILLLLR